MEEGQLDLVLVPLGLFLMGVYHVWLFLTVLHHPKRTVIGLNFLARHRWVESMMTDPLKNGVLAVQTIRNNIMASTLLATAAITLTSIMSVVVSTTSSSSTSSSLVYGSKTNIISSIKYFTILVCFLFAFLCNAQSIRYYAHASFLVSLSPPRDPKVYIGYVGRCLNRGSIFWSLGLRSFYVSFSLFLWIFGPIPMFVCCCAMSFLLYFLDSSSDFSRQLHDLSGCEEEREKMYDVESQQAD